MPNSLALFTWSSQENNFMSFSFLLMHKKATYESKKRLLCEWGCLALFEQQSLYLDHFGVVNYWKWWKLFFYGTANHYLTYILQHRRWSWKKGSSQVIQKLMEYIWQGVILSQRIHLSQSWRICLNIRSQKFSVLITAFIWGTWYVSDIFWSAIKAVNNTPISVKIFSVYQNSITYQHFQMEHFLTLPVIPNQAINVFIGNIYFFVVSWFFKIK